MVGKAHLSVAIPAAAAVLLLGSAWEVARGSETLLRAPFIMSS